MSIAQNYPATLPSLSLDFASVKKLDPRVTFARASSAVAYDGRTVAKAEENLFLRSQDFATGASSATGWNKTRVTVGAKVTAPDGTTTAEPITQAAGQTTTGFVVQTVSATTNTYVASVFAKPNGKNFLRFSEEIGTGTSRVSWIDVSTGTAGTTNAGHVITVTASTEGFYRVSVVLSVNATRSAGVFFSLADTDNSNTVTDSGGLILWQAQLEQRDAVTAPVLTTTQPITNYIPTLLSAPANVARFDHNPVTGESLGLLVEEQRSNLLLRSEDIESSDWSTTGISARVNGANIAPNGSQNFALITENTLESSHRIFQTISLTLNTAYTMTVFAKNFSGNRFLLLMSSNGDGRATFDLTNQTFTTSNATATITSVGNGVFRLSMTFTASSTGNSTIRYDLRNAFNTAVTSYTGDGYSGIYIWGASLEQGSFSSSYIKTEASQVTRSADSASMTGANFSSWYRQDEGSIYLEYALTGKTDNVEILTISDGSTSNDFRLRMSGTFQSQFIVTYNGVNQVNLAPFGFSTRNQFYKRAIAVQTNNFAQSIDNAYIATDVSGNLPFVSRLNFGSSGISAVSLNGTIKKLAFYSARLTDTQLVALTS